jgi:hypothetical protein
MIPGGYHRKKQNNDKKKNKKTKTKKPSEHLKKKLKSLHLWAFEKHLIFQNAHMGWMDVGLCWIIALPNLLAEHLKDSTHNWRIRRFNSCWMHGKE